MENSGKDSFVFYRSFYEALCQVPKKHRTEIYDAIFAYVFESRDASLSGAPGALWTLIKPQLDASQKRYENAKKGAEYGKMGGRPKKKGQNKKPLKGYENETLNVNVNDNDNYNVNDNVYMENDTKTFSPPSKEEVRSYCTEMKLGINADKFFEYYATRGWTLSRGQPIEDWKAAARYWESNYKEEQKKLARNEIKVEIDDSLDRELFGDEWV